MKRRTWVLGIATIVAIGLFGRFFRGATAELAPFRPYIVSEKHEFYEHSRYLPGPSEEFVMVEVLNLSPQAIQDIMHSQFYSRRGWKFSPDQMYPVLYKGMSQGDRTQAILRTGGLITAEKPLVDPNTNYLFLSRPLSNADILLLRIRRIGRNPFDESPTQRLVEAMDSR